MLNHLHIKRTVVFDAGFYGFPGSGNLWKLKCSKSDGLVEARIAFSGSITVHKVMEKSRNDHRGSTSKMRDT